MRDLKGKMLGLMPIVWVGILLSVFQQFVGINVIFYYSTSLWEAVGFGASAVLLDQRVTSIVNILVTIVAIATGRPVRPQAAAARRLGRDDGVPGARDRVLLDGRRAARSARTTARSGPVAGPLALVGANLFVVFFGMTWGPVVWVLLGEMFNNRIRAIALAVAAAAQWLANFVVTASFPTLKGINVALPYLLFTIFAILSFFFVLKMVRETKGRELEDMLRRLRPAARGPGHGGIRPGPPRGSPTAPDQRGPFTSCPGCPRGAGPTRSGRPLSLAGPRVRNPGHTMPRPSGASDCCAIQVISFGVQIDGARAAESRTRIPSVGTRPEEPEPQRERSGTCNLPSAPRPPARRSSPATTW